MNQESESTDALRRAIAVIANADQTEIHHASRVILRNYSRSGGPTQREVDQLAAWLQSQLRVTCGLCLAAIEGDLRVIGFQDGEPLLRQGADGSEFLPSDYEDLPPDIREDIGV